MSTRVVVAQSAPRRFYELRLAQPGDGRTLAHCRQIVGPGTAPGGKEFARELAIEDIVMVDDIVDGGVSMTAAASGTLFRRRWLLDTLARLTGMAVLRSKAARRATIEGLSIQSAAPHAMRNYGQYLIEITKFGTGGAGAYRNYEEAFMSPILARYAYWPELELRATCTSGLGFRADVVKIGYFGIVDGSERLWRDPDWLAFMRFLYRHVAPDSIWMGARLADPQSAAAIERTDEAS